jgi:hypothetical protein
MTKLSHVAELTTRDLEPEHFQNAAVSMTGWGTRAIAIAKCVLVENQRQIDVAQRFGISRQRVAFIVKEFRLRFVQSTDDVVYIQGWLPRNVADSVRPFLRIHQGM